MSSTGDDERFCKLFVARLSTDTNEDSLRSYFEKFGEVSKCVIVKNPSTNQSKGFAFVTFAHPESLNLAQKSRPHTIDNRTVDCKRAIPQDESPENKITVNKMFVGGMSEDTTEQEIVDKFSPYGTIEKIDLIKDKTTGKYKRFCFVTFEDHDSVDQCVIQKHFNLAGRKVEVKKAVSKDELLAATANRGGGLAQTPSYSPQGSRMPTPAAYGGGGRGIYSGSSYGYGDGSGGWYQGFTPSGSNSDGFYGDAYGGGPTRGRGVYTPRGAGPYGGTYGSQW